MPEAFNLVTATTPGTLRVPPQKGLAIFTRVNLLLHDILVNNAIFRTANTVSILPYLD